MVSYENYSEKHFIEAQKMIWRSIRTLNSADYDPEMIDIMANWQDESSLKDKFTRGTYYLAIDNGIPVGIGGLVGNEICTMFVSPDHVKLGIGKTILSLLEEIAREKKLTELFLSSTITSHGFYSKQGFKEVEKAIHKLNDHDFSVYVMKKEL